MRFSALVISACLATAPGCSFALDGPDPARPRGQKPECSTEKSAVILDGLVGTVLGVAALALAADGEAIAAVPALGGATYLYAAISGNTKVNDCNLEMSRFGNEVNVGEMGALARQRDATEEEPDRAPRPRRPMEKLDGISGPAASPPQPPPPTVAAPTVATPSVTTPAPQQPPPRAPVEETWADFWKVVVP